MNAPRPRHRGRGGGRSRRRAPPGVSSPGPCRGWAWRRAGRRRRGCCPAILRTVRPSASQHAAGRRGGGRARSLRRPRPGARPAARRPGARCACGRPGPRRSTRSWARVAGLVGLVVAGVAAAAVMASVAGLAGAPGRATRRRPRGSTERCPPRPTPRQPCAGWSATDYSRRCSTPSAHAEPVGHRRRQRARATPWRDAASPSTVKVEGGRAGAIQEGSGFVVGDRARRHQRPRRGRRAGTS